MNVNLPVSELWFVRERVDDNITRLTEPYVHPFLRCNIWHIRGRDRDLLIDTGMGIGSLSEAAKDLFEKSLSVVITHTHVDHAGGAHEFDTCIVHESEAESLRFAKDQLPLETRDWPAEILAMMEEDEPVGDWVITAKPSASFDPIAYRLQCASPAAFIREGDIVDLGNRAFEVLHLPGHSPGSIGLWEEKTGILFSGDCIYDGALLDGLGHSDIPAYRTSLKRLRRLPVTIVHAGHEPSFGRARLHELIDAYLARRGD